MALSFSFSFWTTGVNFGLLRGGIKFFSLTSCTIKPERGRENWLSRLCSRSFVYFVCPFSTLFIYILLKCNASRKQGKVALNPSWVVPSPYSAIAVPRYTYISIPAIAMIADISLCTYHLYVQPLVYAW